MDQPPGSADDTNPSDANSTAPVRFPQNRREQLSDTVPTSRNFPPEMLTAFLRTSRERENASRNLDPMDIDEGLEVPNLRRSHDQTAMYDEGVPPRAARDRGVGGESPELWNAFDGERSSLGSMVEGSTETLPRGPRLDRRHGRLESGHSRRIGPPTNPFLMEYRDGLPGPHSRAHAEAHQVTPYGTPAYGPIRPLPTAQSVENFMNLEFPEFRSSVNTPTTSQTTPFSRPPPELRSGTAIPSNRHSYRVHQRGANPAAPGISTTQGSSHDEVGSDEADIAMHHEVFDQHYHSTNQARSNPLNPRLARNHYPYQSTRRTQAPVESSTAEHNTNASGPSHTGYPSVPRSLRSTEELYQALLANNPPGMAYNRAFVLEAWARARAGDPSGLRTPRAPRSAGLDRDDGRPPPKSEAEMMMSMECKICYSQPISVAFVPCGESFSPRGRFLVERY